MVITQDKAVFVWVISLNFHSKNFSFLFCKLDLAKIHPTQHDLLCSYGYSQTNEHFIFLWYLLLEKKTNKKTMDSLISCSDTKSFHRILLLPLLFYQVQDSRFSNPDTPSCYKPTLVSHFTTLPPSLWSTQLVSRPHLAQTTPTVFIQANH